MQQRRDEILAKKAKLAELKRQRELRLREISATHNGIGSSSDPTVATNRAENREELDKYISSILISGEKNRPQSTGPQATPDSQTNYIQSVGETSVGNVEVSINETKTNAPSSKQIISTVPLEVVYDFPPSPVKEIYSYSKGIQTTDEWDPYSPRPKSYYDSVDEEDDLRASDNVSAHKRSSRQKRDREAELREKIRLEIEAELKSTQDTTDDSPVQSAKDTTPNYPIRALSSEELHAVTSSEEFMQFVEKSCKVIERALDQDYDILTDYARTGTDSLEYDDKNGGLSEKGRRRVKEIAQFYDERWSKKRMISDINFSTKYPELVLAAYTKNPSAPHDPDGLVQVWNMHLHDRPEYIFHAQSDVLAAKFSPYHPNLIIGGCYSGQVLLWDTRAKSPPVQKTPLTGSGHTHPIYSIDVVGTQNSNNIISCSTDGVVCGWTVDMLAQPQEHLTLLTPPPSKNEDLAPTCMTFPQTDPTYFLVGSEEGTIFPCHRYDRAGAKAGVDHRVSYRGHVAPVMSIDFHPARGPIDLGDLVISSSLDWSVKLWKVRAPTASTTTSITGQVQSVTPILDISREEIVYDASWSPVKPGVFALVDGAGNVEVWDLTIDTEIPMAKVSPSSRNAMTKSLNKVAWEKSEGKRLATGGMDACLTVFEVGPDLGGKESARHEEWTSVKKLVARLEIADATTIPSFGSI
ncbi:unnamed protein product [Blumeria hordei]|uniref:Cytoplasmic dynein intermediate chain n=1 Tax=Blumeria hordei TaxID=2867405 RepID=A0A383UWZ2_BLUHO|nr:unnamed protein product [Blumeria hordei]